MEWRRPDRYTASDDAARVDREKVWRWLHDESYWARGRSRGTFQRSIERSMLFGVYAPDDGQAGFARVVTDYATFAWLCDLFVLPEHRGKGLGAWLVAFVVANPELAGVDRLVLVTEDAHALYEKVGFGPLTNPEQWMER